MRGIDARRLDDRVDFRSNPLVEERIGEAQVGREIGRSNPLRYDTRAMTDRTPDAGAPNAAGSGARTRREIDPAVARLLEARPAEFPPEPNLLRDPPRTLVAIGSIVAIVTSLLPWAARSRGPGDLIRTGWTGFADGLLIAIIAVVLCVLTFNRSAVDSKDPLIRRAPLILGPAALILWANGQRAMDEEIAYWRHQGYDGAYQPWLFVCLAGVLLFTLGGFWLGMRRDAAGESWKGAAIAGQVRQLRAPAIVVAFQLVTAIVAAVAVGAAILATQLHPLAVVMPLILGTVGAGLIGANVGGRIGRRLVGTTADPPPDRRSRYERP